MSCTLGECSSHVWEYYYHNCTLLHADGGVNLKLKWPFILAVFVPFFSMARESVWWYTSLGVSSFFFDVCRTKKILALQTFGMFISRLLPLVTYKVDIPDPKTPLHSHCSRSRTLSHRALHLDTDTGTCICNHRNRQGTCPLSPVTLLKTEQNTSYAMTYIKHGSFSTILG